jgi:hypothetical protein
VREFLQVKVLDGRQVGQEYILVSDSKQQTVCQLHVSTAKLLSITPQGDLGPECSVADFLTKQQGYSKKDPGYKEWKKGFAVLSEMGYVCPPGTTLDSYSRNSK